MSQHSLLRRWLLVACVAALLTTPPLLAASAPTPEGARGAAPTDLDAIAIDRRLTEAEAEGLDGVILVRQGDLDHDLHMTFFTSSARHKAEDLWPEFREHVFAIARRDSGAAGSSAGSRSDGAR